MCAARRARRPPATRSCRPSRSARGRCSARAARTGSGSPASRCRGGPSGCPARRRRASCRRGPRTDPADRHVGDLEAGAEDDRVDLALLAVAGDDRVARVTLSTPPVTSSTLGLRERAVPAVRGQDPLAADRVAGRDLLEQLRVGDLAAHVPARDPLGQLHQPRVLDEAEHEQLARRVDAAAHELLQRREAVVEALSRSRVIGRFGCGMTHGAVRWKTCSCAACFWISGTNWIAEAPVPIAATRLPGGRSRGPSGRSGTSRPRSRRGPRCRGSSARPAGPCRRRRRARAAARRRSRSSSRPSSSHSMLLDGAVEPHLRAHAVLVGDAPQVVADLGLARVGLAPLRVGRERERVEVRRHVAGAARVGVVVPGAADVVAPLEHGEVLDPLLLEADRHAEAGEAAADDRGADVEAVHHRAAIVSRRASRLV